MRRSLLVGSIALILTLPVAGQDLLAPIEDFVNELLPRRSEPTRTAPAPPAAEPEAGDAEPVIPPVPRPRPDFAEEAVEEEAEEALPRPDPRSDVEEEAAPTPPPVLDEAPEVLAEEEAEPPPPAPEPEPDRIYQTACPALLSGRVEGRMLPPIEDGICGERSPLEITAVAVGGRMLPLSAPVTTNCAMAGALADWVADLDAYAGAAMDSELAEIGVGTSMMCRNRNGASTGFVSEHGFANALDITGFTLANGETIGVEADWLPASAPEGRLLRHAHSAACGRFTTVLGPEANAEHEDHLHVDLGCHGQTCTAQICE